MWIKESIEKIKTEQISHRNWTAALSGSFSSLMVSAPGEVLSIAGPSRVGKTKLISELSRLLVGEKEVLENGSRPIINVIAVNASKNSFFDSKEFFVRALEAVEHPFYGVNAPNDPYGIERYKLLDKTSEANLRKSLETSIDICNSKYLVIDEAQHILRCYGGVNAASAFLDSLKSLAQVKKIILVLVGAYPILDALKLSPHMIGREHFIDFPRYKETRDDLKVFNQILTFYSKFLCLPDGVETLHPWNEFLFYGSLGCIGLLEMWIRDALGNAMSKGHDILELRHFKETIRSEEKLTILEEEILIGEEALRKPSANKKEVKDEKILEAKKDTKKSKKKTSRKPFRRNPKRMSINGRV